MTNSGRMQPGNQRALKHGGAVAEKRLASGEEFTGPAKAAELAVRDELANDGRTLIVERAAVRLQAVADLYFNALVDAGERSDYKRINSYAKTFGWLQGKALKAWSQLKEEQADAPNELDYEHILAQGDD